MATIEQLLNASVSALNRPSWEVHKYRTYLEECQLLRFAKDVKEVSVLTLVAWGIPARLALEAIYQSDVLARRPLLLSVVHRRLASQGNRKENDEWSVSSDDLKFSSFRLENTAEIRAKDALTLHIQKFLWRFRVRQKKTKDDTCELAHWIGRIASVLGCPDSRIEWQSFIVSKNWIRTVQDLKYLSNELWLKWSTGGFLPFKVASLLKKIEDYSVPPRFPLLPSKVDRDSAAMASALSTSQSSISKLATLPSSTSTTTTGTFSESSEVVAITPSVFASSLQTLQQKLIEFSTKNNEDEPSWLARNFNMTAAVEGNSVSVSFDRRQARWFLDVKLFPSCDLILAVNLLAVSKVARPKDDRYVLIKHRRAGEPHELIIESTDSSKLSKVVRRVINWARDEQVKGN